MTSVNLQYPIAVCHNKRQFAVSDALCASSRQVTMGYVCNLAAVTGVTVVSLMRKTVLHWFLITSRFLAALIFLRPGQQKPKIYLYGGNLCLPLIAYLSLGTCHKIRKSTL